MNDEGRFTPENFARFVRWVIIIFFVYVFVMQLPMLGFGPKDKPAPAPDTAPKPVAVKTQGDDCSGSAFNNFSVFAMPLFPVTSPTIAASDIKVGEGPAASCGQKATFRYVYARRGGDIVFSNMTSGPETKDVTLGAHEVIPGLERGIIGMKPGGERDISIPPELGFGGVKHIEALRDHDQFKFGGITSFMTARATLISTSPEIAPSPLKLRLIEQTLGNGQSLECGDEGFIKLTLWKMDGTSLYSNETGEPLRFTVGRSLLPYGIEQGVIGMMPGGNRTLIIPPAYTSRLVTNEAPLLKDVEIPKGEILLAVVEIVPEPKPATPAVNNQPATPTDPK